MQYTVNLAFTNALRSVTPVSPLLKEILREFIQCLKFPVAFSFFLITLPLAAIYYLLGRINKPLAYRIQNTIDPVIHKCYQLSLVAYPILFAVYFVRFLLQFKWASAALFVMTIALSTLSVLYFALIKITENSAPEN